MTLEENIIGFETYKQQFESWTATETIFDEKRALWQLKLDNSDFIKVCLYRDGKDMFVYGDYGQFTFDSMTWLGDVYNLQYDNTGYQMEKLSYNSKQNLYAFDSAKCEEDIIDWCIEIIDKKYSYIRNTEDEYIQLIELIKNALTNHAYCLDVYEFCEKNNCGDIINLLDFTDDLLSNTDEYDWIAYLRNNTAKIDEYEDNFASSLWNAGKSISQSYFICMYALKICGQKLKNM